MKEAIAFQAILEKGLDESVTNRQDLLQSSTQTPRRHS